MEWDSKLGKPGSEIFSSLAASLEEDLRSLFSPASNRSIVLDVSMTLVISVVLDVTLIRVISFIHDVTLIMVISVVLEDTLKI